MLKILIQILTLVSTAAILFFGALGSYKSSDINSFVDDLQQALYASPSHPDDSTGNGGDTSDKVNCTNHKDENGDYICDICGASIEHDDDKKQTPEDSFASLFENYDPEYAEINKQVLSNAINSTLVDSGDNTGLLSDIVDAYLDELYSHLDNLHSSNSDASAEELEQAKQEFAKNESKALDGFTDIVTNIAVDDSEINEEKIISSVESVIESDVCLSTIGSITKSNSDITDKVQSATAGLDAETKSSIENILENAKSNTEDASKIESIEALANMLGITLK